jgi:hypothetical protein
MNLIDDPYLRLGHHRWSTRVGSCPTHSLQIAMKKVDKLCSSDDSDEEKKFYDIDTRFCPWCLLTSSSSLKSPPGLMCHWVLHSPGFEKVVITTRPCDDRILFKWRTGFSWKNTLSKWKCFITKHYATEQRLVLFRLKTNAFSSSQKLLIVKTKYVSFHLGEAVPSGG